MAVCEGPAVIVLFAGAAILVKPVTKPGQSSTSVLLPGDQPWYCPFLAFAMVFCMAAIQLRLMSRGEWLGMTWAQAKARASSSSPALTPSPPPSGTPLAIPGPRNQPPLTLIVCVGGQQNACVPTRRDYRRQTGADPSQQVAYSDTCHGICCHQHGFCIGIDAVGFVRGQCADAEGPVYSRRRVR